MVQPTPYLEAKLHLENAREILSKHAGKDGEYYSDPKCVKMACNTAYTGVLVAFSPLIRMKKSERPDVIKFRKAIGEKGKKALNEFNSAFKLPASFWRL